MAKAPTGWQGQSLRHSNARRFGRAGGKYSKYYTRKELWEKISDSSNIGFQDLPEGQYAYQKVKLSELNVPSKEYFERIDDEEHSEQKLLDIFESNFSKLPPIVVVEENKGKKILDGYHRSYVAKKLGKKTISAYVKLK